RGRRGAARGGGRGAPPGRWRRGRGPPGAGAGWGRPCRHIGWPAMSPPAHPPRPRVAFLGPLGTFTEEALLSQPDLAAGELVPVGSIPDVLAVTQSGDVDCGFVAIENSIERTVNAAIAGLAFEHDLLIQRDVVIPVHQHLLA